jgi:hypothetical protein
MLHGMPNGSVPQVRKMAFPIRTSSFARVYFIHLRIPQKGLVSLTSRTRCNYPT